MACYCTRTYVKFRGNEESSTLELVPSIRARFRSLERLRLFPDVSSSHYHSVSNPIQREAPREPRLVQFIRTPSASIMHNNNLVPGSGGSSVSSSSSSFFSFFLLLERKKEIRLVTRYQ